MNVKEIARCAGVSQDTVRFYKRERLVLPQQNPRNGYYVYGREDLRRLCFVRKAHMLGLSLFEIRILLIQTPGNGLSGEDLKTLFTDRLSKFEQDLSELKQLRNDLETTIKSWQHLPEGVPNGYSIQELLRRWSKCQPGQLIA
ncbi:MAG: MerR family transcriptional regulator [Alteromonadaceae bacterium]|nr:MerR family transcriptional regulator [Alteromonadaceae bacterium]MBH85192.1 MerR family transcriptional regulator [Alteromonadaceae bacterium]|tara:strand:- start:461 stop:889 length:429 start_codon:yes stop_codon:yes gene_type:complete